MVAPQQPQQNQSLRTSMFQQQITKISVEATADKEVSDGGGSNTFSDVPALNIYLRQEGDERHVSLERETGSRWISPQRLSMALNHSDLEIAASCRAYGELGFVSVPGDQLRNQDVGLVEMRISPATSVVESTALWITLGLSLVDVPSENSQLSPVLLEIDQAIELEQKAVSCSEGDVQAGYANLGKLFSRRFTHTKDISDLRQAIFSIETSIDMAMEDSDPISDANKSDLAERLSKLGDFLTQCFEATGDSSDLDEVIEALRKAVDITPITEADRRPARLNNLSNALQIRFDISQEIEDIEEAVANLKAAVELTPACHGNLPTLCSNLGSALLRRFESLDDLDDLHEAIANQHRAIDLSKSDHPERRYWLSKVGLVYQRRFERLHKLLDIEESIRFKKLAVETVEEVEGKRRHSNDLSTALQSVAYGYHLKFKATERLEDLEEAISFQQRSLDITPLNSPKTLSRLKNLSSYCDRRFLITRAKEHIYKALEVQQDLIDHMKSSNDDASLPEYFETFGRWLHHRFQYSQDVSDLEQAVLSHRNTVELIPTSPQYLSNLAKSLRLLFDLSQHPPLIEEAITLARKAASLTPDSETSARAQRLHEISLCLNSKNEVFGDLGDIEEAVSVSQSSVSFTSKDEKDGDGRLILPPRMITLGFALQRRYQRTRLISNLHEAIAVHEEAVLLVPETDRNLPFILNGLCVALQQQYDTSGDLEVIERVITMRRRMVGIEESKEEKSDDLSSWIAGLANALHQKFQRTGRASDIDEAAENHRKGVALTSPTDPQLRKRLTNFANTLKSRADLTRSVEDLDEALKQLERARKLTPESHRLDRSAQYLALGVIHQARFLYYNDPLDILFSIEYLKESIELLSPVAESNLSIAVLRQNGGLSTRLNNLGISLRLRFERHGDVSDIQEAISAQQKVVGMTPQDHADYPGHLTSLGNSFLSRFGRTKDSNLANAQERHYHHSGDVRYGRQAASNMQEVVIHQGISPGSRILIAKRLAHLTRGFDQGMCLYGYKVCIKLIAVVGGLEQTIESRHSALASISNIALEAAATAVELGVLQLAMEWLEQGRCLVWTQLNSLRTPMDSIRSVDPSLADRLTRLSPLLESMGARKTNLESAPGLDSAEQRILLQDDVVSHVNLAQEWEEALAEVRAIDGFEDFLTPPPVEEWFNLIPPSAAVIVINVHQTRCDALILQPGATWPLHVKLPNVSEAMVEEWRANLQRSLVAEGVRLRGYDGSSGDDDESVERGIRPTRQTGRSASMLEYVLKQLWTRIVKPIVESLSLKISKDQVPEQRVWWCPTGSLSFLPLHAAGIYSGSDPVSICDYVVSSYIPTLSSLLERLKAKVDSSPPSIPKVASEESATNCTRGILLISEHNAPGLSMIPGAKAEVQAIKTQLAKSKVPTSTLGGETNTVATVEAGVSNMSKFTCVHLACHAIQDAKEPLKSGFHLHDGRLELSKIVRANMAFADLAFLSACQTSAGDEKLSEEAVHLAAGMLAAGYRGVVGTMWSIQDKYASEIAESFYDHLLIRSAVVGVPDIDGQYAAEALHHAITQGIRRKLGDTAQSLLVWVPYVHFGL
ncbi:hypothetical protein EST38_g6759 [Candolleomyces aberdarensis]|uniref:CHAT domain-containing protein n=1 Tax=Candolleomyces aberdarensis TaxID=2316362 RepID=A0A4Q2DIT7_9AGAR|nr:hypothetical protein EST38_g6759 [Candolleomyces aberdarensis]